MAQPAPSPRPANRLARESSPYLLQHAHNPVDWWAWGPEAFAEARRRDVPVFLSIGYSTCYWCHVMERESFESEAVARLMNERFVCVKVDREERPDVDDIYMAAVQIMTGRGGWPMSVFLEPASLKPYWCGTYFPPEPAHGLPSFPQVLDGMARAWRERRDEVLKQAESVGEAVSEHLATPHEPRPVGAPQVGKAISALLTTHDRVRGGFAVGGGAPKFPQPSYVDLLLRFLPNAGDPESKAAAEAAVRLTLDQMAIGGLFDQVGGGFHRYSVDAEWTVPHFEKMLYDNALLAAVYARAARDLDDPFYARVARRTLDYVRREMTDAQGGFHSAQDAEVDGREGLNYLWTPEQVRAAVPGDDGEFAIRVYGLDRGPNFRDPHHPEAPPANVLRLDDRPERVAAGMGIEPDAFLVRIDRINTTLLAARQTRQQPRQDDKVLAGWNGLMIGAMATASATGGLREPAYREAALRAADFILATMRTPDGGLLRSWRAGSGAVPAFLEDYAAVISGLVELHRVADDSAGRYLAAATDLARVAATQFGDGAGGFYDTRAEQADLFVRTRSTYDGAVPCGSSLMLNALIDLHEATGRREHLDAATRCLASISHAIAESPVSTAHATVGLLRLLTIDAAAVAAAVPGTPEAPDARERAGFTPVVVFASTDRVAVSTREPATLTLRLRIAEGYHINAADPGPGGEMLVPLRVGITGGTGVEVFADYPTGEPVDGPTGRILIHKGEIEVPVVLERKGAWSRRPLLTVTFQACTDTECLAPTTVELDVAIDATP